MKLQRFDRIVVFILLGLALLIVAVVAAGSLAGARPPQAQDIAPGVYGPLRFAYAQPMQAADVQARFRIEPQVGGKLTWDDQQQVFSFWPEKALQPGQQYRVRVEAGAGSADGRTQRRAAAWQVTPREPQVVYLSSISQGPEVWAASADGQDARQLTHTGGKVFDFAPAHSGEVIYYSVFNDKGFDLWQVNRQGQESILLSCGSDWCQTPRPSPDGAWLAYVRRLAAVKPGGAAGIPRIWTLQLATNETGALYSDNQVGGFEPSWSPDGARLASYDGITGGIRVLDIQKGQQLVLQSNLGEMGSWTPDGQFMYFNSMQAGDAMPLAKVYRADLNTQQIEPVLTGDNTTDVEYSVPQPSSDGQWLAVGLRVAPGSLTKQLWVMHPDGSAAQAVTDEPSYMHAAYHWDPLGRALIFQRLQLGQSANVPEVAVWLRESGTVQVIARDSAHPEWLP